MLIQFNAAPKRIELQKRAYFHLKDLFKSFQYLIWFSTFEPILGCNDGFYVPTFVTMNTKQILAQRFATNTAVKLCRHCFRSFQATITASK